MVVLDDEKSARVDENGDKKTEITWRQEWLVSKLKLFSAMVKLRLKKSPAALLESIFDPKVSAAPNTNSDENGEIAGEDDALATATDESSYFDQYEGILAAEVVREKFIELIRWLASELSESSNLLFMSEGYTVLHNGEQRQLHADAELFLDDNYLAICHQRLTSCLAFMQILAYCKALRPLCHEFFPESLRLADLVLKMDKIFDDEQTQKNGDNCDAAGSLREIVEKLDLQKEIIDNAHIKLEKFRDKDDLYLLRHGLPGYQNALQKILTKIGGHEWNMPILEVLEKQAAMIETFEEMKQLVDVLPAARSMVDMRIQKSLNNIFKTAFNHLTLSVKKQTMNYFYQKFGPTNSSDIDSDYSTDLNLIINSLAESTPRGVVRQTAVKLSWHFMLSAKTCWWRLLSCVMSMPKLSHALVEVLKFLPVISTLKIPETGDRLVFASLSRVVDQNLLTNEDAENAWIDFCVALCNGHPKKPIFEPALLVNQFLLPLLPKHPSVVLGCLTKIFADKTVKIMFQPALTPLPAKKLQNKPAEPSNPAADSSSTAADPLDTVKNVAEDSPKTNSFDDSMLAVVGRDLAESETESRDGGTPSAAEAAVDVNDYQLDADSLPAVVELVPKKAQPPSVDYQEIVDPLKIFGALFGIFVKVEKQALYDNTASLNLSVKCRKGLLALIERWRTGHADDPRPLILDPSKLADFRGQYTAVHWSKRLFADWLLVDFCAKAATFSEAITVNGVELTADFPLDSKGVDCDGLESAKIDGAKASNAPGVAGAIVGDRDTFTSDVPACLFDRFDLPRSRYNRQECCEDEFEPNDPQNGRKLPAACALSSLLELATISGDMSSTVLKHAGNLQSFTAMKSHTLRKCLIFAASTQLAGKILEEFKSGICCLRQFLDRFDEEYKNGAKNGGGSNTNGISKIIHTNDTCNVEKGYLDGMKFVAPLVLCCDAAVLQLVEQAKPKSGGGDVRVAEAHQRNVKLWLANLLASIGDCSSQLTTVANAQGDDFHGRLAVMTSLRQLWTACALLLEKIDGSQPKSDTPRAIDFLFVALLEAFHRSRLEFDEGLLSKVASKLNGKILDVLERKLRDVKLDVEPEISGTKIAA